MTLAKIVYASMTGNTEEIADIVAEALENLAIAGRPLSQSIGIQELAEERLPIYEAWANLTFPCLGSPDADAKALLATVLK